MNKLLVVLGFIFVVLVTVCAMISEGRDRAIKMHKYDVCIEVMSKALPDPNDDSRASFLENCQK